MSELRLETHSLLRQLTLHTSIRGPSRQTRSRNCRARQEKVAYRWCIHLPDSVERSGAQSALRRFNVDVDEEALKTAIIEAGENAQGVERRRDLCHALALALGKAGEVLSIGGSIVGPDRVEENSPFDFGSDATVGLGTVAQIGGELCAGVITLLDEGNRYGAAALLRQLVEVEYLTWAFAEDEDEAMGWMRSTKEERMRLWQPRHIREKAGGRFRALDYGLHCEQGGHPSPAGIALLPTHKGARGDFFAWNDLAGHGLSAWNYVLSAADQLGYNTVVRDLPETERVAKANEQRQRSDPLLPLLAKAQQFLDGT